MDDVEENEDVNAFILRLRKYILLVIVGIPNEIRNGRNYI